MSVIVSGIHHVSIVVKDIDVSLRFYSGLLGLKVDDTRPNIGYPGAWLNVGTKQIHLLEVNNVDPVSNRPEHVGRDRHTALEVADISVLANTLDEVGIAYTRSQSGRKALFCRDPDGNGLEFVQIEG